MNSDHPRKIARDEDPWLRALGRWELRVMKIVVLCGVIIFAYKLLRHEVEQLRTNATPATLQVVPVHQ